MNNNWDLTQLRSTATEQGTPLFVYSRQLLLERAKQIVDLKLPFGYTPRYAIKANNHPDILQMFHDAGLQFDASSSYEANEILAQGIPGEKISLSSQQPAHNLQELLQAGVKFVATSMHQLELVLREEQCPKQIGLRVNPGIGAGHNNRLTTGGANSSFGLWNAYVPEALQLAKKNGVKIDRLHVHIGSGADPTMWGKMIETALSIAENMHDVTSLNMGGGYKIHRYGDEHEADLVAIGVEFSRQLQTFAKKTGRKLHLEIEPGTWLVGHAGVLLASVVDVVDTGDDGHTFLRLDTGMNDFARPGMYGAQHRVAVLNDALDTAEYVLVGHNCETADILTPAPGDPEGIESRELRKANIGDTIAIYDTGAYCRSMSHKGYNSFPNAGELFI
ncbi:diaminopimelate decarboxylase [Candidatus Saccharibacteria bacterium]|nr:MAG: diaminopimelate decarboxylase [Candidatus Saccharibacteria bacterium]